MILRNPVRSAKLKPYPQGHIYQGYGENIILYLQAIKARGHTGIDIATFEGDEILAAHSGIVVEVYNDNNGYGHHVRVVSPKQPDGTYFETIYGHLSSNIPVVVGQEVRAGDVIGYESNTGFVISGSTPYWGNAPAGKGVHLHWGLRILEDVRPNSAQVSYSGGKYNYSIINYINGLFGYIDPMPYLNTMYKYAVDENNNQHILYTDLKIDIEISDVKDLDKLVANGLTGAPEQILTSELNSYYKIVGVEKARFAGLMKDLFNL